MRSRLISISGAGAIAMVLQGCVSPPSPPPQSPPSAAVPESANSPGASPPPSYSSRRCKTDNAVAKADFRTRADGIIEWLVTFDAATTNAIESHTAVGEDGQPHILMNELDCLLDNELRAMCPKWTYRDPIATDLPDGRLETYGVCADTHLQP
jgi:hypothetical protein